MAKSTPYTSFYFLKLYNTSNLIAELRRMSCLKKGCRDGVTCVVFLAGSLLERILHVRSLTPVAWDLMLTSK